MHREEILWLFRIGFQLLAQTYQVGVDGSGRRVVLISPHIFEQLIDG